MGGHGERYFQGFGGCCCFLLAVSTLIVITAAGEVAKVGSSLALWTALLDQNVTTIQVTRDIELGHDVWPGDDGSAGLRDFMIPLGRNLTLEKDPKVPGRPKIDLDYMRFRVEVGDGMLLELRSLEFRRSARDPEEQFALDFFGLGMKSVLFYDNVIAEVAVDMQRSMSLFDFLVNLPRPDYPPELQLRNQSLDVVHEPSELCKDLSGRECPYGGLWLEDFANVVQLTDKSTGQIRFATLIAKDTFLRAVDVSKGWPKSTEEKSGRKSMIVQDFADLGIAIRDPEVSVVFLWKNLLFGMSSWPNWEGKLVKELVLTRNLTVTTHPVVLHQSGMASLDFNYAEKALHIGERSTLTLKTISLDRTRVLTTSTVKTPSFVLEPGSGLVIEDGRLWMPSKKDDLHKLGSADGTALTRLGSGPARGYGEFTVDFGGCKEVFSGPCEAILHADKLVLWQVPSESDGFGDRRLMLPTIKPQSDPIKGHVTLIQSMVMCYDEKKHPPVREEDNLLLSNGIATVSNEENLHAAMMSQTVAGVYVTASLNISEAVWPRNAPVFLNRDFFVSTHPHSPVSAALDFDYLYSRVKVGVGHSLFLEWMNFTRVSNNGEGLHYVPFFSWQDNTTIEFKDILSQMAVEPSRTGALDDRYVRDFNAMPGPSWFDDPHANFTQVELFSTAKCLHFINTPCDDGALYIHQGVQQVPLGNVLPRNPARRGGGVFIARNMLLIANDLERKRLLTREEEAIEIELLQTLSENSGADRAAENVVSRSKGEVATVWAVGASIVLFLAISALAVFRFKYVKAKMISGRQESASHEAKVTKDHHEAAGELLGDVVLGSLMGVGGFARVYRATWNGAPVAVKVILHKGGVLEASIESEALLSTMLRHPHIVQGYHYVTRTLNSGTDDRDEDSEQGKSVEGTILRGFESEMSKQVETMEDGISSRRSFVLQSYSSNQNSIVEHGRLLASSRSRDTTSSLGNPSVLMSDSSTGSLRSQYQRPALYRETWLVQEFCDMGCLSECLQKGLFLVKDMGVNMPYILRTARDIARGMTYLHDDKIIHGDLKSSNVLLQHNALDPRGYIAKVADFGLSRQMMAGRTHMSTTSFGTVTHMPPEVLMQGHLSLFADVYSFGVILWEMVAGDVPFRNMMQMEVMRKVVLEKKRPEIPGHVPDDYRSLIEQCWCHEPSYRLTFRLILDILDRMLMRTETEVQSV